MQIKTELPKSDTRNAEVLKEDLHKMFPQMNFLQWLWHYFSLEKKHRLFERARKMADQQCEAFNKRYYVFILSDGNFYVLSRKQIDKMCEMKIFKRKMNFLDIVTNSVYQTK